MNLESCKNLIQVDAGHNIEFKLLPLFNDQKLDIKNCILEIEYFLNAMPPQNIALYQIHVKLADDDEKEVNKLLSKANLSQANKTSK